MCARSFHSAGTSSEHVTVGVPRLSELLNAKKAIATPAMTLSVSEDEQWLQEHLHVLTVGDLLDRIDVAYDEAFTLDAELEMFAPDDELEFELDEEEADDQVSVITVAGDAFERGPWVLRLQLASVQLNRVKHTLEVVEALTESCDLTKFVRDVHATVRRGGPDIAWMGAGVHDLCARLKNRAPWAITVSATGEVLHMRAHAGLERDVLCAAIPAVRSTRVRGLEGVASCRTLRTCPGSPGLQLQTDGSNLAHGLKVPQLIATGTWKRLLSNDVLEVRRILGVEAARQALLLECGRVLECDGNYVSARHLLLLVDMMTLDGGITSVGCTGVVKGVTRPLGAATYEESADIIYKAAAARDSDDLQGPSQRVIFGERGAYGTGAMDLLLDQEALQPDHDLPPQPSTHCADDAEWAPDTPFTWRDPAPQWCPASPVRW